MHAENRRPMPIATGKSCLLLEISGKSSASLRKLKLGAS